MRSLIVLLTTTIQSTRLDSTKKRGRSCQDRPRPKRRRAGLSDPSLETRKSQLRYINRTRLYALLRKGEKSMSSTYFGTTYNLDGDICTSYSAAARVVSHLVNYACRSHH